jgi:hypothetical protein
MAMTSQPHGSPAEAGRQGAEIAESPRLSRNYVGDVSLAIAIVGGLGIVVLAAPTWSLVLLGAASIGGLVAVATARARLSRESAVSAAVVGGSLLVFGILMVIVVNG